MAFKFTIELEGKDLWRLEEAAEARGLSTQEYAQELIAKAALPRRTWSKVNLDEARELRELHWSYSDIASKLGVPVSSLKRQMEVGEYAKVHSGR